jgi:O-antigen ligase
LTRSAALPVAASASFVLLVAALPWSIAPISVAVVLCLALTLAVWWSPGGTRWRRTPLDLPALGWIAALVIAALFALDPAGSLPRVKKGLLLAVVPVAAWHARDPRLLRRALAALLVSGALATVYALARFAHDGGAFPARVRGLAGHALTYGGQATLLAAVAMSVIAKGPGRRWTAGAAALLLLLVPALAGSYTRSAWIATFVAAAVILSRSRARLLPLLVAVPAIAVAVAPGGYRERALSVFDSRSVWNRERLILWDAGLRVFAAHPVTGVGLQDLRSILDRAKAPGAHEHHGHLHNVPLQVAVSMGAIGLAALAWLIVGLFRTAGLRWRAPLPRGDLGSALRLASVAALAAFLVAGLFEWNLGDEELLVFLCVLVGMGHACASASGDARLPRGASPPMIA